MANYKPSARTRKYNDWHYHEKLPQAIRLRSAASTLPWSACWLLTFYRKLVKQHGAERGLRIMLNNFDMWDTNQARKTWIAPPVGKEAEPSPCAEHRIAPLITSYACVG